MESTDWRRVDSASSEMERRRYALLQAAAIIFAKDFNGVPSDEDFDFAVDCAENLLDSVESREVEAGGALQAVTP